MGSTEQGDAPLLLACGSVDITPENPIPLSGHSSRIGPFERVHDTIEANAMVLAKGARRVILVSTDLLYVGPKVIDGVLKELGGSVGSDELFLAASHNHFAPSADETKPALGICRMEYVEFVINRVSRLVKSVLAAKPTEVTVKYREQPLEDITINRRRVGWRVGIPPRKMMILPNPKGFVDNQMRIIEFLDSQNRPVAVLWNFACHPVAFPAQNSVSSEFPGITRSMLRKQYGREVPILFLQGFGGDTRPNLATKRPGKTSLKNAFTWWLSRILNGDTFGVPYWEEWATWSESIGAHAVRLVASDPGRLVNGEFKVGLISLPLGEIGLKGPAESLTVRRVDIGDLSIIGFSAEPVAEYFSLIAPLLSPKTVIPVGCVGHVFGYLPTNAMIGEGGYEVDGFIPIFGVSGKFRPDVESVVVDSVSKAEFLSDSP